MTVDDLLRQKNDRLRGEIDDVLRDDPELRNLLEEIAIKQGEEVQMGMPFLERVQADLQERARAIMELRPDLKQRFEDYLPNGRQTVCRQGTPGTTKGLA